MEVGEDGDYIYTCRYTVITRMTPALSDESHFNVSLIVRDKVTRQCSQTTTSEEKRRAEVRLLISLTARPNRLAKR